jgi:hypothetical protein
MITRKKYLAAIGEVGPDAEALLHHAFYIQFATPALVSRVRGQFGPEELLVSRDPHLNDIPLARWDDLARSSYPFMPHHLISDAGAFYSLSFGVCLLKAIARDVQTSLRSLAS